MSRPARAKPTRSLRCSIDVEPSWRAHDELHRLAQQVVVVVVAAAAARRRPTHRGADEPSSLPCTSSSAYSTSGDWRRQCATTLRDLVLVDPGALDALGDARARAEQEHVALADAASRRRPGRG